MLYLSEVLMEGHALESFKELCHAVSEKGKSGEREAEGHAGKTK